MKFINYNRNNQYKIELFSEPSLDYKNNYVLVYEDEDNEDYLDIFDFMEYQVFKQNVKRRKILKSIKKGVTSTEKKNSIKRDINNTLLQQFINVIFKEGKKEYLFNQINIVSENLFYILNEEHEDFFKYKDYKTLCFLSGYSPYYNNFNLIFFDSLIKLESLFDIKTKKNPKKLKLLKKFSHEVVFIPKIKRLKNTLKVLNLYSESFKYYKVWERFFWMILLIFLDQKKSFVFKRRNFIYKKSLKFFSKKKSS